MAATTGVTIQRRLIVVRGIVQGVGFRPFVYAQALQRGLVGHVFNDSRGVTIEIEGTAEAVENFQSALQHEAPPLARIDTISAKIIDPQHNSTFTITESQTLSTRQTLIAPDTATCEECIHELFEVTDRRSHYPFINCTNCGPRFTIIQDVPYDRSKTTMRDFPLCKECQREYSNPLDRRFHAQPNACPVCGPHVCLIDWENPSIEERDAIEEAAERIARGDILAIKGLGGYHLACDAMNVEAVQKLRRQKQREAKPFALMVPDIETAERMCVVSNSEKRLLQSRRRPIVLLQEISYSQKQQSNRANKHVTQGVAPGYSTLGIMLPYTPLHHLLLDAYAKLHKEGSLTVLVMTSGNLSEEPIVYKDSDVQERLKTIAEGMLTHNRTIHIRCDDSIVRVVAEGEQILRRSRGYVPEPISLAEALPMPILACGGQLKNTFCLGKERQAFVSHHIGDLENLETLTSYREGIEHFQRLFDIQPEAIVYDLHPEYLATKYALSSEITEKIAVQHHHAHIVSVLAEHGLNEPVIGVAVDGTGYGTDGAIWGCEIMRADLIDFERLAHLAYVPMPGSEQAIRQPWRMAAAYLVQTYGERFLDLKIPFVEQIERSKWRTLSQMIEKSINSPVTSSLGRLFDAVAALLGLRGQVQYEGQAAIELEIHAEGSGNETQCYPFAIEAGKPGRLNVQPLLRALVEDLRRGVATQQIARRFHNSIAEMLGQACQIARQQTGIEKVALSGGVFQNKLLLERLMSELKKNDFQVYINRQVPPNDGGISLGQIAVAGARLQSKSDQDRGYK